MSCCGKGRDALRNTWTPASETPAGRPMGSDAVLGPMVGREPAQIFFEYQGTQAISVIGPITGQRYRFASPGLRIAVDSRDAPSVGAVPGVRRLR